MLALEEIELAFDQIDEPPAQLSYTSSPLLLLIRTWNVYHGRTFPPGRRTYLEQMIRLVTADAPDIVGLQEVPLWAFGRLESWSGMAVRCVRAMPALLGPLGHFAARRDPVRFRSAATGQGNAVLVNPHFRLGQYRTLVLNPELTWRERFLHWEHRRVCQSLEIDSGERQLRVGNVHTAPNRDQVARAGEFLADAERCVLCGDFNLRRFRLAGFTTPIAGLDQILLRGLEFEHAPAAWPVERRRVGGVVLSDHAPVEAVIA